ncbi:hypothetical protein SDC9_163074 [bioreactor metagenome]|uniref:Minor capsid protein n=1 Tax=bioreactor metagenome TaxID=1076179 RepID=A0A645FQS5_9ZZZZ|nr:minor capsid protein [Candidatus Pelethousia sp.]
MSSATVRFEWNKSTEKMLAELNLGAGGMVQRVIDNAVIRYSMDYVPFDEGVLARSPYANYEPGQVVYAGPYARYHWHGIVMSPNIPIKKNGEIVGWYSPKGQPKTLTERKMKYQGEPKRGPYWALRMKADHLKDIVQEAQDAVRK